ncbi:hypothetical protein AOC36_01540 [Erysipelothrix larvae]|uniref:Glycosyl hydrolase family 13 catalytic domain-containing protein n=1 Tax=Erysipelothrix larvae TaxID=1514105 RepID=A0A120JTF9_9FIRM|nr:alpha-amylase [Erysipelothrix larvae]AMC92715.1 hypothetical protein AOC36_01540 [Erysipelothrix larvae]
MNRKTLFQAFQWYVKTEDNLWVKIKEEAKHYKELGLTMIWLPPAYKGAAGSNDTGYGVYDLYDLGEFDQKGSERTKYGTKQEYLEAIQALKDEGIDVMVDVVLNHRIGADGTEEVPAKLVNSENRMEEIEEKTIEAWTQYNFEGRGDVYSDFKWNHTHFTGIDYDARDHEQGVFLFDGKEWATKVDAEYVNYDYLMGADVDFSNQEVRDELLRWIRWYKDLVKFDGVRLDAVKHIQFPFFKEALRALRGEDNTLVAVGEYWSGDLKALHNYLMDVDFSMSLFDVPLHHALQNASIEKENYDLRTIFNGTLVSNNPHYSITFVDNHDTQPGQSLESFVEHWFKPHAYALTLLRDAGTPCVFYGDLYGDPENGMEKVECLELLMKLRQTNLYGTRFDFLDDAHQIGWVYTGNDEGDGCVVVINNANQAQKRMFVGKRNAGKTFVDALNPDLVVEVDSDGTAVFSVMEKSISVYVSEER